MSLDIAGKRQLKKFSHSLRASQAVLQYGVGAMIDFPDQTLMTAAPEFWETSVVPIHDERLERILKVDYFGMPGSMDERAYHEGISFVRFPEWYFCPACRRFDHLDWWIGEYKRKARPKQIDDDPDMVSNIKCPSCRQKLVVTRIITVCKNGHIDDFPWVKWVHSQNTGGSKKICSSPKLTFKTGSSSSEGLEGLQITCEACHARATLRGAFDLGKFEEIDKKTNYVYDFSCRGRHPWKNKTESCNEYPKIMQRGSSSVYFPVISSSLVIPPFSNQLTNRVENNQEFGTCRNIIAAFRSTDLIEETRNKMISDQINQFSEKIARGIGFEVNQVRAILIRKWLTPIEDEYSTLSVKFRAEEYTALSGEVKLDDEFGDFQRVTTQISDYDIPYIKGVSLIQKIREIQALTGFTRINPSDPSESPEHQANVVSIKEPSTKWYPGYEVRGEGIFIEFDSDSINKWKIENPSIEKRVNIISENYNKSFIGSTKPRTITAKFLLLHTISHMLIKQLSFECGYSIASIKERIYCAEPEEGKEMAGILIYTASGDSEGTLGGLVRQGRSDIFPSIFKKSIETALSCSNDPVCSLSNGQGRDSLNLSACHACSLIPETSCEEFNIFLDRGVVIGTFEDKNIGFYSKFFFGNEVWEKQKTEIKSVAEAEKEVEININIIDRGTNMVDSEYDEIWKQILNWADSKNERDILMEALSRITEFRNKEKPFLNCTFTISDFADEEQCDLCWVESKVMYFSQENEDSYNKAAKDITWTCYLGSSKNVSLDSLLDSIR